MAATKTSAATKTLAPSTAVRFAWAIAGQFASEPESKICAQKAEEALKNLSAQAATDPKEHSYVSQCVATIQAAVRSLEVIYKGRELNFEENEKLRQAYIDNVQDSIQFGSRAKDYLKALPSMVIAGPGVAGTLGPTLVDLFGFQEYQTLFLWGFGAVTAGLGYLIYWGIVLLGRKKTQMLYVKQDYERNLYYDQYVARIKSALEGLYEDIDRLHEKAFSTRFGGATGVVNDVLKGTESTMCQKVHEHMKHKIVTPEVWTLCEVGGERGRNCDLWAK
jgi:hypothetical protein